MEVKLIKPIPMISVNMDLPKLGNRPSIMIKKLVIKPEIKYQNLSTNESFNIIIDNVCEYFNVAKDDLFSKTRLMNVVKARHSAMVLCENILKVSTVENGRLFGRDHSTVLHAKQSINGQCDVNRNFKQKFDKLSKIVESKICEKNIEKMYSTATLF